MPDPNYSKKSKSDSKTGKNVTSATHLQTNKINKRVKKGKYYTFLTLKPLSLIAFSLILLVSVYLASRVVRNYSKAGSSYIDNKQFGEGSYSFNESGLCISANQFRIDLSLSDSDKGIQQLSNNGNFDVKQYVNQSCKISGKIASGWRRMPNRIGNQEFNVKRYGKTYVQEIKSESIETGIEQNISIPKEQKHDYVQYSVNVKSKAIKGQLIVRVEGTDYFSQEYKSKLFYSKPNSKNVQDIGGIVNFLPKKVQIFTGLPNSDIEIAKVDIIKLDSLVEYNDEDDLTEAEKINQKCGTGRIEFPLKKDSNKFNYKKDNVKAHSNMSTDTDNTVSKSYNPIYAKNKQIQEDSKITPNYKKMHNNTYTSACILVYFPANYDVSNPETLNGLIDSISNGLTAVDGKLANEISQGPNFFHITNWACDDKKHAVELVQFDDFKLPDKCLKPENYNLKECQDAKVDFTDAVYTDIVSRNYDKHQLNIAFVYGGRLSGSEMKDSEIAGIYMDDTNVILMPEASSFGNEIFSESYEFYDQVINMAHEMGHAFGLTHSYYPSIMGSDGYKLFDSYWMTEKYFVCNTDLNSNKGALDCSKYHHETVNTNSYKIPMSLNGQVYCLGVPDELKTYLEGDIRNVKLYLVDNIDNYGDINIVKLLLDGSTDFNVGANVDIVPTHRYGFMTELYDDKSSITGKPTVQLMYVVHGAESFYFIDPYNDGNIIMCPEYGPLGSCMNIDNLDFALPLPQHFCNTGASLYEGRYDISGILTCENKTLPYNAPEHLKILGVDKDDNVTEGSINFFGNFVLRSLKNSSSVNSWFLVTGRDDIANIDNTEHDFHDYAYGEIIPYILNSNLMVNILNKTSSYNQYKASSTVINLPTCDLKRNIHLSGSIGCLFENGLNLPDGWNVRVRIKRRNKYVDGVNDNYDTFVSIGDLGNFVHKLDYDPLYNYLFHIEIYNEDDPNLIGNFYRDWYSIDKVKNNFFVVSELDEYFQPKAYRSGITIPFNSFDFKLSCDVDMICYAYASSTGIETNESNTSQIKDSNIEPCESPSVTKPVIDFRSDKTNVSLLENYKLMWNVYNADSCAASGDWNGEKPLSNQIGEAFIAESLGKKIYTLTCTNTTGGIASRTIVVNVSDSAIKVKGTVTCQLDSDQALGKRIVLTRDDNKKWYSNYLKAGVDNQSQPFEIRAEGVDLYDGHLYSIRPDEGESEHGLQFDPNGGGTYECIQKDPNNPDFLRVKRNVTSGNCSYDGVPQCGDIGTSGECWQYLDLNNVEITALSCSEHPEQTESWVDLCEIDNQHGNWFNMTDKAYFYVEKNVPGEDGNKYLKICFDNRFPPHNGNSGQLGQKIKADEGEGFLVYINRDVEFNENGKAINPDFVTGNQNYLVTGDFDGIGTDTPDVYCTRTNNTLDDKHSITMDEVRSMNTSTLDNISIKVFPVSGRGSQPQVKTCYKEVNNLFVGCRNDIKINLDTPQVIQPLKPAPSSNVKLTWNIESKGKPVSSKVYIWKEKYDNNLNRWVGSIIAGDITSNTYVDKYTLDQNSKYRYGVGLSYMCEDQEGFHNYTSDVKEISVYSPQAYVGKVTGGRKCEISGWARDQDVPTQSINIHIYADGNYKNGKLIKEVKANKFRSDLADLFGGNQYGNYGFEAKLDNIKDGQCHPVYIYAINATGTNGNVLKIGHNDNTLSCDTYKTWQEVPSDWQNATAVIQCK